MQFHCIKPRHSIEPRDRIHVKGYGLLSFAKNMGESLSNKYGQKLLDSARKSTTDAMKTASKRAIKKTAEATGDLIGKKIPDNTTSASTELHSKKKSNNNDDNNNNNNNNNNSNNNNNNHNNNDINNNNNNNEDIEIATNKKRYIPQKKDSKLLMNQG